MNNLKSILLLGILSLFHFSSLGADENLISGETLNNLTAESEVVVRDSWYLEYQLGTDEDYFSTLYSNAKVTLWFDNSERRFYDVDWNVMLVYDIALKKADGTIEEFTSQELSIDYDVSGIYRDIDLLVYDDDIYIEGIISNVSYTVSGIEVSDIPSDIHLDLELNSRRFYNLDSDETVSFIENSGVNDLGAGKETTLFWSFVEGAESYDIEWLFIDEPSADLTTLTGPFYFQNASRVNVLTTNYSLNLAYPRGLFIFRVRPVGSKVIGGKAVRIEGLWSMTNTDLEGDLDLILSGEKLQFEGLMPDMNWEYRASYAQEGKKGEVISIYDGSLKPRQRVTVNNSDNTALIQQSVYDYLGRPSISLLPTPEENKGLGFYTERLKFSTGDYYDFNNFDVIGYDTDGEEVFNKVNHPDNMEGLEANNYYSTEATIGIGSQYVADAGNYPFSRVLFTKDGTGRVRNQTGVGNSIIGSQSLIETEAKIVRNLYGTPTQEELYRLYGNEVGSAAHYKKNAIIDQNAQVHLQYLDASGRVIATFLGGDAPENLLEIDSYPYSFDPILSDLTVNNTFNESGELILSKRIVVPYSSTYDFEYSLAGITYLDDCIPYGEVPFDIDVKYDVLIYIEDEEYNRVDLGLTMDEYDAENNTLFLEEVSAHGDISFSVFFPIGEYTVNKVLSINQDYLNSLEDAYKILQNCYDPIITEDSPCNGSCEELCFSGYGYVENSGSRVITTYAGEDLARETVPGVFTIEPEFDTPEGNLLKENILAEIAECEEKCDNGVSFVNDPCERKWLAMLADMSPGGQYFDNNPIGPSDGGGINDWLLGLEESTPGEVDAAFVTYPTWDLLRENWEDGYATKMVHKHPEFCIYSLSCGLPLNYGGECPVQIIIDGDDVCFPLCPPGFEGLTKAEYDNLMHTTSTPSEIGAEYLFNPTNLPFSDGTGDPMNYQFGPVLTSDIQYDPFVNCRDLFKSEINDRLKEYLDVNGDGSEYHSIWFVIDNPLGISEGTVGYSESVIELYETLHGPDGIIGPDTETQLTKYQFFRSTYLFIRDYVEYYMMGEINVSGPEGCSGFTRISSPMNNGISEGGFLIHFPENLVFETYTGGISGSEMDGIITDACLSQCEIFAEAWMLNLSDCASESELAEVKQILIDICAAGCDEDNPYGTDYIDVDDAISSTISGIEFDFHSFEQVINELNDNPALTGSDCMDISHPMETPDDLFSDCECDNISKFLTDFYLDNEIFLPADDMGFDLLGLTIDEQNSLIEIIEENLTDAEEGTIITIFTIQNWVDICNAGGDLTGLIVTAFVCGGFPDVSPDFSGEDCSDFLDDVDNHYNSLEAEKKIEEGWQNYIAGYTEQAWNNIETREVFTMGYLLHEYHYTLFYYDQAGNLIKTVPPAGVYRKENTDTEEGIEQFHSSTYNALDIQKCKDHLTDLDEDPTTHPYKNPNHELVTNYKYNSLQQLIEQTTPDGGKTTYWYDALGRLIVSQNARQGAVEGVNLYSYTIYDQLGRVVEAGEISAGNDEITESIANSVTLYESWLESHTRKEVIRTIYNQYQEVDGEIIAEMGIDPTDQTELLNLRGRIGSVVYYYGEYTDALINEFDFASHYNYDYAGNVKTVIHENGLLAENVTDLDALDALQYVKTNYIYDLISGNVLQVDYQKGKPDEFHYKYEYDANNRLTTSYSSRDCQIWEKESKNFYYAHGPLARQEIGDEIVQACDYVYTVNGWLKAVNSSINNSNNDAGKDGKDNTINENIGIDAASFSLHYFEGDYQATGAAGGVIADIAHSNFGNTVHDLYNGNIHQMITSLNNTDEEGQSVLANKYRYDQLQRIKKSNVFEGTDIRNNNRVINGSAVDYGRYKTAYTFDGNGNLLTLNRNAGGPLVGAEMDNLSYNYDYHPYDSEDPTDPDRKTTNQLLSVNDSPLLNDLFDIDVDDQEDADNYAYDEIGQLKHDYSNDIQSIEWTVTGKVKRINYNNLLNSDIETTIAFVEFEYDPMGNRISKSVNDRVTVYPDDGSDAYSTFETTTTYYMNDASGNVLGTYTHTNRVSDGYQTLDLKEHHLYGSKRLGLLNRTIDMQESHTLTNKYERVLGQKSYELSNHLGNVLAVVSDRKLPVENLYVGGEGTVNYYQADVTSFSEYYPYGMVLPGRSGSDGGNYRYGFQGQEDDPEVKGEGNSTNYKYRMHDPRIGRFFAVDPLTPKYPHYTPYSFSGNKVIQFIEFEGLEEVKYETTLYKPRMDLMSKEQLEGQRDIGNMLLSPVRAGYNVSASFFVTGLMNVPSYVYREATGEYGYDEHFQADLWIVDDNGENHLGVVEGEQANMEIVGQGAMELVTEAGASVVVYGLVSVGKRVLKRLDNVPTSSIDDVPKGFGDEWLAGDVPTSKGTFTINESGILKGTLEANGETIIFEASVSADGNSLVLDGLDIFNQRLPYQEGAQNLIGPKVFRDLINEFKSFGSKNGFDNLRLKYDRNYPEGSTLPDGSPKPDRESIIKNIPIE